MLQLLQIVLIFDIIFYTSGCGAAGSVLPWGGRGRPFKSGHSDQNRSINSVLAAVLWLRFFHRGIIPLHDAFFHGKA